MTAQVIHADAAAYLAAASAGSVDLVLTSPPYDAVRDYHGKPVVDLPALGPDLHRVLKPGGAVALVIGDGTVDGAKTATGIRTVAAWLDDGLRLWESVIYERHGRPGAWWGRRFRVDHEMIYVLIKGKRLGYFDKTHLAVPAKHAGKAAGGTFRKTDGTTEAYRDGYTVAPTKCRGTVWRYSTSNTEGNRLKAQHPATFPDALAGDLVRAFCPPGGLVLDPFAGSGTTLVAAALAGRDAIGVDISADYCAIARQRLETEAAARLFPLI